MKNIIIQIGQWILKHKKRLIYGALALFIGQICFFGLDGIGIESEVFAAETPTQSDTVNSKMREKNEILGYIQKIVIILIYPVLVLVGTLVDNSLVYGKIFGFDVVLRELWNITRNLANFTIGFIFIYKIFKYLISEKKEDIKKFLISLLIAGVGIQASWFVMAALIDISTLLTYSVGGLPIYILKDKDLAGDGGKEISKYNPYILKTLVTVDVNDIDKMHTYLTNTSGDNIYISECKTIDYQEHVLLFAPSIVYYEEGKDKIKPTIKNGCHYAGQVYYFTEPYATYTGEVSAANYTGEQSAYETTLATKKNEIHGLKKDEVIELISQGKLLERGNAHITGGVRRGLREGRYTAANIGLDVDNTITGEGKTQRFHEILSGDSYVGIYTQLYSSLINSGKGIVTEDGGVLKILLSTALYLFYLLAVSIPLIAAGIVFMIRIGILRIAIIISPFIVLFTVFEDIGNKVFKGFLEYFKLGNLIPIIFSPAVICLAVSLSTVLVTIISNLGLEESEWSGRNDILGGMIKVNIGGIAAGVGNFIISIFGIAVTWFLVWAAVGLSKLGEKDGIVGRLRNLAEDTLGSIPIVPIPGKEGKGVNFIGAKTAFGLGNRGESLISRITDDVKNQFRETDSKAVEQLLNPGKKEEEARQRRAATESRQASSTQSQVDKYTTYSTHLFGDDYTLTTEKKRTEYEFDIGNGNTLNFSGLNLEEQKKVIEEINNSDNNGKKDILGQNSPNIRTKDGTTYTYTNHQYVKSQNQGGNGGSTQ